MSKLKATLGSALVMALASTGSALAACVPSGSQPAVPGDFQVGVLQSDQGAARDVGVIRNIFSVTKAKLDEALPGRVRVLSDADAARPEALAGLKVIVLPETKGLSRAQRRALLGWTRQGGGLVSLYFSGRDDEVGTPLIRRAEGWGGRTEWAELSPAFGARFLNDVYMTEATFSIDPEHPLAEKAARFCGATLPDYAWRRGTRPTALTGELAVSASRKFVPLARLKHVKITWERPEKRAVPGSIFAWTNSYRQGRLVHFGFNFMDAWQPWTFQTFYEGVDPHAPDTGTALLRGAVEWASAA